LERDLDLDGLVADPKLRPEIIRRLVGLPKSQLEYMCSITNNRSIRAIITEAKVHQKRYHKMLKNLTPERLKDILASSGVHEVVLDYDSDGKPLMGYRRADLEAAVKRSLKGIIDRCIKNAIMSTGGECLCQDQRVARICCQTDAAAHWRC